MSLPEALQIILCFLLVFLHTSKSNTTFLTSDSLNDSVDPCESPECVFYERVFLDESKKLTEKTGLELIRGHGFPLEEHELTSEDGYILKIFRIPHGRIVPEKNATSRIPVILHHGFIADGFEWIFNAVDKALGYRLADSGYDIWLINNRGSYHSLGHTKISWRRSKYWNFGFHEIAVFDVPLIIDYILKETNQPQIYYIGHSLGCSCFLATMSMFPEYNTKIKAFVGLAPAIYIGSASAPNSPLISFIMNNQGIHDSFLQTTFVSPDFLPFTKIIGQLCSPEIIAKHICSVVFSMIFGFDFVENSYDARKIHIGLSSSSMKVFYHIMQLAKSGKFQRYDYLDKNLQIYGQRSPPLYDLDKVTVPVYIYCGTDDSLVPCKDAQRLSTSLRNVKAFHEIPKFNHLDFLYYSEVNPALNDGLVEILNSLSNI